MVAIIFKASSFETKFVSGNKHLENSLDDTRKKSKNQIDILILT